MTGPSPNRSALIATARALGPLREEMVFLGGQVAELLITDPASVRIRPTDDVDAIVAVATRTAYFRLGERLRDLGFREDASEDAPLCRWRYGGNLLLDVMPLSEEIPGFTNRWYQHAFQSALLLELEPDRPIRVVTAPAFVATKWTAFDSRGKGDLLSSHDVEDIVTVVAGRRELHSELLLEPVEVRAWLSQRTTAFLAHPDAAYAIEGALPDARFDPGIIRVVHERFAEIAAMRS